MEGEENPRREDEIERSKDRVNQKEVPLQRVIGEVILSDEEVNRE